MTELHLKLVFGILATIVTLVFMGVGCFLAISGATAAAAIVGIGGPIAGSGGLFWLFERMTK